MISYDLPGYLHVHTYSTDCDDQRKTKQVGIVDGDVHIRCYLQKATHT